MLTANFESEIFSITKLVFLSGAYFRSLFTVSAMRELEQVTTFYPKPVFKHKHRIGGDKGSYWPSGQTNIASVFRELYLLF